MKKNFNTLIKLVLVLVFFLSFSPVFTQTIFKIATADGYAEGTTGGGDATPVTVTTASEFITSVTSTSPAVVIVSGSLNVGSVSVKSDKTIIGADSLSTLTGNLALSGVSNIIIQNLNITNKSGVGTADGIEATNGCTKIFVHKCTFIDCKDGSFDIKRGSTDITVSWCRFEYPTNTSHCFANLIGHSDSNGDQDRGKLHVTMHHNWYDLGCQQRMPRVRFGQVHVYNNFYGCPPTDPLTDYTIGVGVESSILVESSYFENITNTWWEWTNDGVAGKIQWNNLCLVNSTQSTWATNSNVFDPPYTYSVDSCNKIKTILTNSSFGAGNTRQYIPDTSHNTDIEGPGDINNIYCINDIEIGFYPNPANNLIQITGLEESANFMLFDLSGKILLAKKINNSDIIAIDAFPKGLYIVKIITATGISENKLIKK